MGFWDVIGKGVEVFGIALAHQQAVDDLMRMSESAGMVHLGVLVPSVVEGDWMSEFRTRLRNCEQDESESEEYRQKARTFRVHASYLAER
jgi:hypothetical protein